MPSGELLIAQITDVHLGSTGGEQANGNKARLDRVLDHLTGMRRRPDLLLVSGDLADGDSEAPYRHLKERLDRCPFPAHVCIGNHDNRALAQQVFGSPEGHFFHYVVDAGPLRLIILDTVDEERHGGAFCDVRSSWLREKLAEAPARPTLIALHHPPIDTGIDWLTTSPAEPWLARLDSALAEQEQVIALVAGHVHRAIHSTRNGIPVHVCPSVAAPLILELAPLDPGAPDGRPLVADGPPGYALHLWRDGTLTSHVDYVSDDRTVARFDEKMQPLVQRLFAERP